MSPSSFFLVTLGVTVLALALQAILRRIHRRKLERLATEWKMHYSPDDRFRLAGRVAEMLPIPGAAQVRVMDLIYGNEKDGYRYLFSASFTEGVIRTKRRNVRVASFRETRDRDCADSASPLLADLSDEIARLQSGPGGRRTRAHAKHHGALGVVGKGKAVDHVVVGRRQSQAKRLDGVLGAALVAVIVPIVLAGAKRGHVIGLLADLDVHVLLFAGADDGELQIIARLGVGDDVAKLLAGLDLLAVDRRDDVAVLELSSGRRGVAQQAFNQHASVAGIPKALGQREILRDVANLCADESAHHLAVALELFVDRLGLVRRNGKADSLEAAARGGDGGVD